MMTEHFSFEELTNSASHPDLVAQNRIDAQKYMDNLNLTANALEQIRAILGCSLTVSSGFRNSALNSSVGGSKTSKHMLGLCADIAPTCMGINDAFKKLVDSKSQLTLVRKVIIEGVSGHTWIHIQAESKVDNAPIQYYSTNDGKNFTEVKA